jgi:hypothetical protein
VPDGEGRLAAGAKTLIGTGSGSGGGEILFISKESTKGGLNGPLPSPWGNIVVAPMTISGSSRSSF